MRSAIVTDGLLEREILSPARRLVPVLDEGTTYIDWLRRRCEQALGHTVPLVAAHNDLTMWNVLLDDDSVGVVDWVSAREQALPLGDYYYSLVDAVAATDRYKDRHAAFRRCFDGKEAARKGERSPFFRELTPAVQDLCFHACWLHLAANEQRCDDPANGRPFLRTAQSLAAAVLRA